MEWDRCIAHVDMQAFFPSCEQVDFPELKDKAIAVRACKQFRLGSHYSANETELNCE